MSEKKFRRVYLTLDADVMHVLKLNHETVTAHQLRQRLRELCVKQYPRTIVVEAENVRNEHKSIE